MSARGADLSAEAAAILGELERVGVVVPQRDTLLEHRAAVRAGFTPWVEAAVAAFDGAIESETINGIECRVLTPAGWREARDACVLYAFGGGFVTGSTFEDQVITAPLATAAGARVVMPEYRLSPEHPYPAPQADLRAVYPPLLAQHGATRLAVAGESAGGNQALGLLQHARDSGLQLPACAVLLSPWCDLGNRGDSHEYNDGRDPALDNAWVDLAADWHAGATPRDDPGVSPLYADMAGLPPVLITSGSRDLLLSQCLRLAVALRAAGVDCELHVRDGLWHVFEFYPIPEARASLAEAGEFIRRHCAR